MAAVQEDIVIVGAGIAGLTTSLGLHRYPLSLSLSLSLSMYYIYVYIYKGLKLVFEIVKKANML
jgi:hypothetical protein